MIEILGYSLVNGSVQYHRVFKNNFVDTVKDVDKFEEKILKRYSKKYNGELAVYAVYRQKIN